MQTVEWDILTYKNIQPGTEFPQPLSRAWREWSVRCDLRSSAEWAIGELPLLPEAILRRRSECSLQNKLELDIRWCRKVQRSYNLESWRMWFRVDRNRRRCSPARRVFLRIDRNLHRVYLREIELKSAKSFRSLHVQRSSKERAINTAKF